VGTGCSLEGNAPQKDGVDPECSEEGVAGGCIVPTTLTVDEEGEGSAVAGAREGQEEEGQINIGL